MQSDEELAAESAAVLAAGYESQLARKKLRNRRRHAKRSQAKLTSIKDSKLAAFEQKKKHSDFKAHLSSLSKQRLPQYIRPQLSGSTSLPVEMMNVDTYPIRMRGGGGEDAISISSGSSDDEEKKQSATQQKKQSATQQKKPAAAQQMPSAAQQMAMEEAIDVDIEPYAAAAAASARHPPAASAGDEAFARRLQKQEEEQFTAAAAAAPAAAARSSAAHSAHAIAATTRADTDQDEILARYLQDQEDASSMATLSSIDTEDDIGIDEFNEALTARKKKKKKQAPVFDINIRTLERDAKKQKKKQKKKSSASSKASASSKSTKKSLHSKSSKSTSGVTSTNKQRIPFATGAVDLLVKWYLKNPEYYLVAEGKKRSRKLEGEKKEEIYGLMKTHYKNHYAEGTGARIILEEWWSDPNKQEKWATHFENLGRGAKKYLLDEDYIAPYKRCANASTAFLCKNPSGNNLLLCNTCAQDSRRGGMCKVMKDRYIAFDGKPTEKKATFFNGNWVLPRTYRMAPGKEEDAKKEIKILQAGSKNKNTCLLGCGQSTRWNHMNCVTCTVTKSFEQGGHAVTNTENSSGVLMCNYTSHDGRFLSIEVDKIVHKSHFRVKGQPSAVFPSELQVNPTNLNDDDFLSMLIECPQMITDCQEKARSNKNLRANRRAVEFRQSQEHTYKLFVLNQDQDDEDTRIPLRDRILMNPAQPDGTGDFREFKDEVGAHITHLTCVKPSDIDRNSLTGNKFLGPEQWNMIPHLSSGQQYNQDNKTWGSAGGIAGGVKFFFTKYTGIYHWIQGRTYYAYYIFGLNPSYANYHQLAMDNGAVMPQHKLLCFHTCSGNRRVEYDLCVKIEIQDGDTIETCKLTIVRIREEDTDSPRTKRVLKPLEEVEIEVPMNDNDEDPRNVYANMDGVFLSKSKSSGGQLPIELE